LPAWPGRKPHQILQDASGGGSHLMHQGHGQSASAVPARRRVLADVGPARVDAETFDVARRPVRYVAPAPHQDRRPRRRDEDDDPSALADLLPRAGYPALRSGTHTAPRHLTGGARAPRIFTIVPSTPNPPHPKLWLQAGADAVRPNAGEIQRNHQKPRPRRRSRQSAALSGLAGARSQPVVVAFEDLHWADPTSLDLLRVFADRGAQAPLLLLATTRPEFRPSWSLRSHHSVLSLSPLDRAGVARMVGEISARHALSKELIEGVNERTGGVPLFVEEVTRLLVERGAQGGVQAIPPTLQQSLAARLDRLGQAREVAQIGAVLGRDFTYTLLRAVGGVDDPALQSALDRLAGADLLIAEGAGREANYRFKHALIQDAAYDSLLKSRRQALHRRAAEILRDDPERAAAEPELVAHHFTKAGLDDLAIEWWGKAGDQALRRSAFQEAIAHLGKAIALVDKAGATARRAPGGSAAPSKRLTQMQVAYGNALLVARGQGAPETTEAFARARESASGDKDAP